MLALEGLLCVYLKWFISPQFLNIFLFLKENLHKEGKFRDKEVSPVHWFTPQMVTTTWAGNPGAPSGSFKWVRRAKELNCSLLLSQSVATSWMVPVWDAGAVSRGLAWYSWCQPLSTCLKSICLLVYIPTNDAKPNWIQGSGAPFRSVWVMGTKLFEPLSATYQSIIRKLGGKQSNQDSKWLSYIECKHCLTYCATTFTCMEMFYSAP